MAFVPASSIPSISGPFVVSGTVALDAASLAALETVTVLQGTSPWVGDGLTDAQLAARLPLAVTGPLTNAQLLAAEPFAVTGPLTAAQLLAAEPLAVTTDIDTSGLATEATLARVNGAVQDVALTAILERERNLD
jgi:hypothetical protein